MTVDQALRLIYDYPESELSTTLADEVRRLRDAEPKWTYVSDRLPPKDERVLVCARNGRYVCIGSWNGEDHLWEVPDVMAWMPLPAPVSRQTLAVKTDPNLKYHGCWCYPSGYVRRYVPSEDRFDVYIGDKWVKDYHPTLNHKLDIDKGRDKPVPDPSAPTSPSPHTLNVRPLRAWTLRQWASFGPQVVCYDCIVWPFAAKENK